MKERDLPQAMSLKKTLDQLIRFEKAMKDVDQVVYLRMFISDGAAGVGDTEYHLGSRVEIMRSIIRDERARLEEKARQIGLELEGRT